MADLTIPSVTGGVVERNPAGRVTVTVKSGQTIVGGALAELSGEWEVQTAGAESKKVLGIALFDGDGSNKDKDKVTVAHAGVWDLTASGTIAAGALVQPAAAGAVKALDAFFGTSPSDTVESADDLASVVGVAMENANNGEKVAVLLRLGGSL